MGANSAPTDDFREMTKIEGQGTVQISYRRLAREWVVYYWNNLTSFAGQRSFGLDEAAARYAYNRIKSDLDAMREGLK